MVRTTKSSISIADPDGGRNMLKGAIYEQSFNAGEGPEQKSKAQQQNTGEMLKAAFSEHEKSVKSGTERKRKESAPPSSTTTGNCPQP
ncbi:MbeB family mobilization protein [Enterobacter kobei]|uniref:MbeB family mobilization protein n=1 Tax=Enterobacter kobei TaxID=208224 RepID=UPI002A74B6C8|nr:MbeB family mobilization protein [Enterobacter kobei]MDY3581656.1 MbeB family mobilization protein [Enterobacter kobei]